VTVRRAVILAAGLGGRLRGTIDDRPKGLIEFDGESLVDRSIRLLRAAGVWRTTLVIGHHAARYRKLFAGASDLDLVENAAYAETGSMASLAIGLRGVAEPVLVLEGDIAYERRALDAIVNVVGSATLASGITGAGDEVWVQAPAGRLASMSKNGETASTAIGEFVGITRLDVAAVAGMCRIFEAFVARTGHGRMSYETDALVALAQETPVSVIYLPDLVWGEIDDEAQLARVAAVVWPSIRRE
jgi:2-aminoethylphosphonate-pyruvate transaminase